MRVRFRPLPQFHLQKGVSQIQRRGDITAIPLLTPTTEAKRSVSTFSAAAGAPDAEAPDWAFFASLVPGITTEPFWGALEVTNPVDPGAFSEGSAAGMRRAAATSGSLRRTCRVSG